MLTPNEVQALGLKGCPYCYYAPPGHPLYDIVCYVREYDATGLNVTAVLLKLHNKDRRLVAAIIDAIRTAVENASAETA